MKKVILAISMVAASFFGNVSAHAEDCFDSGWVNGWDYDSTKEVLNVSAMGRDYEVAFSFNCNELNWAHTIAFDSFFSSQVCRGDKVVIIDSASSFRQSCYIKSVTRK